MKASPVMVFFLAALMAGCSGGGGSGTAAFTISGMVVAAAGSVADGDVNDPAAPLIPNNTIATAQEIPNPVYAGGYVNQKGSGAAGRSRAAGDPSDLYKVALAASQPITLTVGDLSAGDNDLDLFLMDASGNLVDSSEGVAQTEFISAPASAGTYIIEVFAFKGASNYVLSIGQGTLARPLSTLSVLSDFEPGELVARFHETKSVKAGDTAGLASLASSMGMSARAGGIDREVLLSLDNIRQDAMRLQVPDAAPSGDSVPVLTRNAAIDPHKRATIRAIKALRGRADIKYAEPNYICTPQITPNDVNYPLQWHYPLINLPQAWDITTGDNNVVVAVIDTGVLSTHPDLQGQLLPGYDFISNPLTALDGDGIDNNPDDPGGGPVAGGSLFHGTHVTGTIAAATNNAAGVAGIAWATAIMPLRALGQFSGTLYDIMQAIRYAAGLSNDSNTLPAQRADIINLSLGNPGYSQAAQDLLTQVRNEGVIVVAAAGNEANSLPFYPAAYEGVVSVSAVDINRNRASYSNFGASVDVAAPGGESSRDINGDGFPDGVLSTVGDDSSGSVLNTYDFLQGTSMATPHVAGVAALMRAVNPALSPEFFDALLASGQLTEDLGTAGRDDIYGYGLINAYKAVIAAQGGATTIGPVLVASPQALNFGTLGTSQSLFLENAGGDTLIIDAPGVDAGWLTIAENVVDQNGNGSYTVTVNRSDLLEGTYTASITATSSVNALTVPVIMQVSTATVAANAGYQYILLLDPVTFDTAGAVAVNPINGSYTYTIGGVPGGNYLILSGNDSNNDGYICDAGESCGAYRTLDKPVEIELSSNQSLGEFTSSYVSPIVAQSSGGEVFSSGPYRRYQYRRVLP